MPPDDGMRRRETIIWWAMWSIILLLMGTMVWLLFRTATRPGVPYTYQTANVPEEVCLGGVLEYDVELTINQAPITVEVVRAFYQGGRSLSQTFDKRPYVVNGPYRYHLELPLPMTAKAGALELRAVGSAISYVANGYGLTVNVIDCDEEKGAG